MKFIIALSNTLNKSIQVNVVDEIFVATMLIVGYKYTVHNSIHLREQAVNYEFQRFVMVERIYGERYRKTTGII